MHINTELAYWNPYDLTPSSIFNQHQRSHLHMRSTLKYKATRPLFHSSLFFSFFSPSFLLSLRPEHHFKILSSLTAHRVVDRKHQRSSQPLPKCHLGIPSRCLLATQLHPYRGSHNNNTIKSKLSNRLASQIRRKEDSHIHHDNSWLISVSQDSTTHPLPPSTKLRIHSPNLIRRGALDISVVPWII